MRPDAAGKSLASGRFVTDVATRGRVAVVDMRTQRRLVRAAVPEAPEPVARKVRRSPDWREWPGSATHWLGRHSAALLQLTALGLVVAGVAIAALGLRADHAVQKQATKLTREANQSGTTVAGTGGAGLSTVKPRASDLATYTVPPDQPRYIIIPKLSVYSRVLSVGVDGSGALATPKSIYDTAWYNKSAKPGQPGAMLIDGHTASYTAYGVFNGLPKLVPGDTIEVVRGDGEQFTYRVVRSQVYPSTNVDMAAAMTPAVVGQPGLNLITCSGDVLPSTNEFDKRIVVFAEQVTP